MKNSGWFNNCSNGKRQQLQRWNFADRVTTNSKVLPAARVFALIYLGLDWVYNLIYDLHHVLRYHRSRKQRAKWSGKVTSHNALAVVFYLMHLATIPKRRIQLDVRQRLGKIKRARCKGLRTRHEYDWFRYELLCSSVLDGPILNIPHIVHSV